MELKQVLTDIARAIVDNPDAVSVEETIDGNDVEELKKASSALNEYLIQR